MCAARADGAKCTPCTPCQLAFPYVEHLFRLSLVRRDVVDGH